MIAYIPPTKIVLFIRLSIGERFSPRLDPCAKTLMNEYRTLFHDNGPISGYNGLQFDDIRDNFVGAQACLVVKHLGDDHYFVSLGFVQGKAGDR
jgi:hypothetical protein